MRYQWGSSSALARQIQDGAPAHLFLSASERWIEHLQARDLLRGVPVEFARGDLVCIVRANDALARERPPTLRAVFEALEAHDRVAIGDPGVPVGEYARAALNHFELLETARPFLVGQTHARSVVRAVATGAARAGFVYSSDARDADLATLYAFPEESHPPVRYWACALNTSHPQGADYLEFLQSASARSILNRCGFR